MRMLMADAHPCTSTNACRSQLSLFVLHLCVASLWPSLEANRQGTVPRYSLPVRTTATAPRGVRGSDLRAPCATATCAAHSL